MVWIFGSPAEADGYRQSLFFVLLQLPVFAGTTYFLLYVLVPRFLLKRNFFLFGLYSVYTIIVAAWLEILIVMGLLMVVYEFQIQQLNPRITDLGFLAGTMVLVVLPAVALHISWQWYQEREIIDRLKQEKLELELYAREKELEYLKEQMRPHFLFNVLNNLYGLTLEKSDLAPELVLKVSGMLDYMLYRSSGNFVMLDDEIKHIDNYIEIQKIRCGNRFKLAWNVGKDTQSYKVAPLVLLPLVENSFKHGVSLTASDSSIDISVSVVDETLEFSIKNSLPADKEDNTAQGVGLENVRKRLDLLYGNRYKLNIRASETEFAVELSIPLNRISNEEVDMYDR